MEQLLDHARTDTVDLEELGRGLVDGEQMAHRLVVVAKPRVPRRVPARPHNNSPQVTYSMSRALAVARGVRRRLGCRNPSRSAVPGSLDHRSIVRQLGSRPRASANKSLAGLIRSLTSRCRDNRRFGPYARLSERASCSLAVRPRAWSLNTDCFAST